MTTKDEEKEIVIHQRITPFVNRVLLKKAGAYMTRHSLIKKILDQWAEENDDSEQ